jgi:hypothetical protein
MSKPIRIESTILERAEVEGRINRRSPPKQIEYWAEIGRQVSSLIDAKDLFAVFTGAAALKVTHKPSQPVPTTTILEELRTRRDSGELQRSVTGAIASYGIGENGLIRRISAGGRETVGKLIDGKFVPSERESER